MTAVCGTVNEALMTLAEAPPTVGAWNVRSGRPGMAVGTVSTTLPLDGAAAFAVAVKKTLTLAWASAMSSFAGIGSTERLTVGSSVTVAVVALVGGSISIARLRLPVTAGTQAIVVQWVVPILPPAPLPPVLSDLAPA